MHGMAEHTATQVYALRGVLQRRAAVFTSGSVEGERHPSKGCQGQLRCACALMMQGTAEQQIYARQMHASAAAMSHKALQVEHLQNACTAPDTAEN